MGFFILLLFIQAFWKQILIVLAIGIPAIILIETLIPYFFKCFGISLVMLYIPVGYVLSKIADYAIARHLIDEQHAVRIVFFTIIGICLISAKIISLKNSKAWDYKLYTGLDYHNANGINESILLQRGIVPPERPGVDKKYIEQIANSMGLTTRNGKVELLSVYLPPQNVIQLPDGKIRLKKTGIGFDYPDTISSVNRDK
jgi:hypothetical protein